MVVLKTTISLERKLNVWDVDTKSSNSSASALNLFTKPFKPKDPDLPNARRGLSLDDNAVSRNTMRGYAIGIPMWIFSLVTSADNSQSDVTDLYNDMFNPSW